MLSDQQLNGTPANTPGATSGLPTQPPPAGTVSQPAAELAIALTQVLEGDAAQRSKSDTRVQQTIGRLKELIATSFPSSSNSFHEQLEQSEIYKKLKASLASVSDTVQTQGHTPWWSQQVNLATHTKASIQFADWWREVAKTKGLPQWRTELQHLGCSAGDVNAINHALTIGEIIFAWLLEEGTWHESDLQNIVIQ
ncbi:unnamed protein product [Prorocentrum cordatum]|uniref:Uncharacterized protein n=1 Tax=Prorocentrum cordatum TaxID=2364126 RepID=A0ABN9QJ17_9DINO|nr:unnamed protein product [Polarella glacialis]